MEFQIPYVRTRPEISATSDCRKVAEESGRKSNVSLRKVKFVLESKIGAAIRELHFCIRIVTTTVFQIQSAVTQKVRLASSRVHRNAREHGQRKCAKRKELRELRVLGTIIGVLTAGQRIR